MEDSSVASSRAVADDRRIPSSSVVAGPQRMRHTPRAGDSLRPSLENSRKMKEKSHRAARRCYRSGSETFLRPNARRLDGHSLYTASHLRIRAQREAGRRGLRHAARQFGRRGGAAEEPGYPVAADEAGG